MIVLTSEILVVSINHILKEIVSFNKLNYNLHI